MMKLIRLFDSHLPALFAGFCMCLALVFSHAISAEPLKVGVTASLSGAYKEQGESLLHGVKMWADDVNARGALLGRVVEVVFYDDASDPDISAARYEKLIKEDQVDLLVGPYASDLTHKASEIAEKYNMPMVSGTAAAEAIWERGFNNIFQVDVPASHYMRAGLRIAKDYGFKRIAVIYQDNLFTREVAEGALQQAKELGMTITVFESYSADKNDFSDLVLRMKQSNTELVLGASYFDDAVAIVKEAKKQNFSPRNMGFTSAPSQPHFGDVLGLDADGILGFTSWFRATRRPMADDFDYRYREKYGRAADSNAAGGYAAGEILEAAVRLANSVENDAVREQLGSMAFLSIMGRYKVDESGKQMVKEMFLVQWQDGRRVLALPDDISEARVRRMKPWDER